MKKIVASITLLLSAALFWGCGDNLAAPAETLNPIGPPQDVTAVSVNSTTVRLFWSASPQADEPGFTGYLISYRSMTKFVDKSVLNASIDSLPQGMTTFRLQSVMNDSQLSAAVNFTWAPAARFDTAYDVFESNLINSNRTEGLSLGSNLRDPSTMVIEPTNLDVQERMDMFFFGGRGQIQEPLALWGADLYWQGLKPTRFSTVVTPGATLDDPLATFPDPTTFVVDSIAFVDNAVYYVRITTLTGTFNYARIHVHVKSGTTFPNRIIEVKISLQRIPSVPYAEGPKNKKFPERIQIASMLV